ncbi:hypothetical protein FDECE_17802, partial [Fusarium decemcellulare]
MLSLFTSQGINFNPATDIPSFTGRVVLITGGNSGLGKESVLMLAEQGPLQVWLAARSWEKAQIATDEIQNLVPGVSIKPLELDLASLESVKNAARAVCEAAERLDLILLNAGTMSYAPGLTKDGYEIHFGTNYMGHALLTKLLLPLMLKTAVSRRGSDVRAVFVSSAVHKQAPEGGIQFDKLKSQADGVPANRKYGQSKLATVLFARELAKRHPLLKFASIHPGAVDTPLAASVTKENFWMRVLMTVARPFMSSVEDGAKNQLWAATSKDI